MLLGHTLGEVDGQLGADQAPALTPPGPLFGDIHHSQVQHFQQAVVGGKDGFCLGHLAQLVDDTVLNLGLREYRVNGRVKPCEIVRADNKNVLYTAVFQTVQYDCPELDALIFADPHSQNIFPTVQVYPNGNVYCFLHDLPFAADMVVDSI